MAVPARRTRSLTALAAAALLLGSAAGCGSDQDDGAAEDTATTVSAESATTAETAGPADTGATDAGATDGSTGDEEDEDSAADDDAEDGSSTTTEAASSDDDALAVDTEALRVAPMGSRELVLLWNADGVWTTGHTGERTKLVDGPIAEVADVPDYGIAFQREPYESTIWLAGVDGVRDLIVATGDQQLTLEGAGQDSEGVPILYYQRHTGGTIEDTESTLRHYDFETGEVTELAETGSWESGTVFASIGGDHLTPAFGSAEGWIYNVVFDLADPSAPPEGLDNEQCFTGDSGCVVYEMSTTINPFADEPTAVGVRPIWDESGDADLMGVFEFDLSTGEERELASFDWQEGAWYVEDLFVHGEYVALSLGEGIGYFDEAGAPLPALFVHLETGEAFTLPEAMFVRPLYLT